MLHKTAVGCLRLHFNRVCALPDWPRAANLFTHCCHHGVLCAAAHAGFGCRKQWGFGGPGVLCAAAYAAFSCGKRWGFGGPGVLCGLTYVAGVYAPALGAVRVAKSEGFAGQRLSKTQALSGQILCRTCIAAFHLACWFLIWPWCAGHYFSNAVCVLLLCMP